MALDAQFYEEPEAAPVAIPCGKFAMYPARQPDADFQRQAALWGVALREPVTAEELAAFIAYWQAEGKVFTISSGSKAGAQRANQPFQQWRNAAARHQ